MCCYLTTGRGMYPQPRYKLLIRQSVHTLGTNLSTVKWRSGLFPRVGSSRHAADHLPSLRIEDNVRNYTSYPLICDILLKQIEVKQSHYRPDRPSGFQEVETPRFQDNWHMKVLRLSALRSGRLYHQKVCLVLLSVRGWVNPRAMVRPEGLFQWKSPVIPSGIEPATLWLVAKSLIELRHRVPRLNE
jgi:hypothetical protein